MTTRSGDEAHDGFLCSDLPTQSLYATVRRMADGTVYVATWQGCFDARSHGVLYQAIHAVL